MSRVDVSATTIRLGDADVPRIGLGTNRLTNTADGRAFIRDAVAAGVLHVDTAHLYTGGESETSIGAGLSPRPPGAVIATKGGYRNGDPATLREEIEASLAALRTDAWLLARSPAMLPIPGTRSITHLTENLAALGIARGDGQADPPLSSRLGRRAPERRARRLGRSGT